MADAAIVEDVRKYLARLPSRGIRARRGVLFGSHAKGTADRWSDIDLVVLAPEFDKGRPAELVNELWLARELKAPIEPIPCGEMEWETDDSRPILEIARREGIEITID